MLKVSYKLLDEPPDLKKCAICGEKSEGGCIPLGSLCGKHIEEWGNMVLKIFRGDKNVESD
jgi:hypothetical protein